jgi:hypothetical protein
LKHNDFSRLRWGKIRRKSSTGGWYFLLPLFYGGRQGQPVLAQGPWFADIARRAGLAAFRDRCGSLAKDYLVEPRFRNKDAPLSSNPLN